MRVAMLWLVIPIAACDCGGDGGPSAGPCAGDETNVACDRPCGERPCPGGLYCASNERCTADCDSTTGDGCRDNEVCTTDGMCIRIDRDGGPSLDTTPGDAACASVRLETERVTPNVLLIVDQSGSMTAGFGGSNRWDALRDSLLDQPEGLIFDLQDQVRFGLALFTAEAEGNSSGPPIGMCPMVELVDPAIRNYDAIRAVYQPADPIDETPTGDSIDFILDALASIPDPSTDPTIFILATDGEPDRCEELNPQNGQEEALAAVERAYDMGIRTFIISVGEGTISEGHLQDVANAGLGVRDGDPDAEFFVAGDDDGLRDSLRAIIGGELSCVVELSGRVSLDEACSGSVRLNGRSLSCDDPNGWEPVDETRIELLGDACDELQSGPGSTLEAVFPCDVILI
ncbi:MAG: vWA domain-containing protein [Myxococcota bacterium]